MPPRSSSLWRTASAISQRCRIYIDMENSLRSPSQLRDHIELAHRSEDTKGSRSKPDHRGDNELICSAKYGACFASSQSYFESSIGHEVLPGIKGFTFYVKNDTCSALESRCVGRIDGMDGHLDDKESSLLDWDSLFTELGDFYVPRLEYETQRDSRQQRYLSRFVHKSQRRHPRASKPSDRTAWQSTIRVPPQSVASTTITSWHKLRSLEAAIPSSAPHSVRVLVKTDLLMQRSSIWQHSKHPGH